MNYVKLNGACQKEKEKKVRPDTGEEEKKPSKLIDVPITRLGGISPVHIH